ncbi:serologically defined colon cancer antigen 8 homolog [Rhincodon typus]|uniref:serologically defined colon cancer antigen 8 homolog n=1 Tax=Rhincodon typus TaxID=259920 RepID=UPI00202EC67A|nr:serologically defined colon cancer antigen 8 homolog [Rhincodon typus]
MIFDSCMRRELEECQARNRQFEATLTAVKQHNVILTEAVKTAQERAEKAKEKQNQIVCRLATVQQEMRAKRRNWKVDPLKVCALLTLQWDPDHWDVDIWYSSDSGSEWMDGEGNAPPLEPSSEGTNSTTPITNKAKQAGEQNPENSRIVRDYSMSELQDLGSCFKQKLGKPLASWLTRPLYQGAAHIMQSATERGNLGTLSVDPHVKSVFRNIGQTGSLWNALTLAVGNKYSSPVDWDGDVEKWESTSEGMGFSFGIIALSYIKNLDSGMRVTISKLAKDTKLESFGNCEQNDDRLQENIYRKDLSESQKECQQLEERLKVQESLLAIDSSERVSGLCVKCAQHEAVLARTHNDLETKAVERLRKERDDLMNMLATLRTNINEMQAREDSACRQVKQATEVAEEANLEKIQALVHCEQLKNEMLRQKERLEREFASQQEKIAIAKKAMHEEMRKEREALASKVTCLSENVTCLEGQLQRLVRERDSACNQLEEAQNKLINHEMEINKESGELRYQLNEVKIKKEEAEKEFREYKTKMLREFELREQELQKLELKLNETKCHLEHVQQDAARSKDECLKLMELLSKSEHQLHLTRMEKDSILHSHSDDVKALAFQSQQREQELTEKIQQMEAQHDKTVNSC